MMKDIFGKALGINKPWFVADVNFDLADNSGGLSGILKGASLDPKFRNL